MKILLTNDDGIYADGIQYLTSELTNCGHHVAVSAPDRERSAAGHSITIHNPLRAYKIIFEEYRHINFYKIDGTPADCVKLGVENLIDFKPDLIISGINDGPNLGYDVLYSGTVSAAIEGWMMGYKALAISLAGTNQITFKGAAKIAGKILQDFNFNKFKDRMLLNINIPDIEEDKINEIRITELTRCQYEDYYETRVDPVGKNYYWLTGKIKGECVPDSDMWAVKNNMISITPLKLNLTDYEQKLKMSKFDINL